MKKQTLRALCGLAAMLTTIVPPAVAWAQAMKLPLSRSASVRDIYEQHNTAAMSARAAGDWAAVRRHAAAVDTLFNGNPSTLLAMARAQARMGDHSDALETLRTVVSMGVTRNLAGDNDLVSLHSHTDWPALIAWNEANLRNIGEPKVAFSLPGDDLIAEDIAWDGARHRYLVSSVRKGEVVSVARDGTSALFVPRDVPGGWGIFALAVDSLRSRLWLTTVAMPHVEGYSAADSGRSAVLRLDLKSGSVEGRYDLPWHARGTSPGDIAVASNGDLYISDSRTGMIHVIRSAVDSLEVLVPEGTFMSPQGPAVARDERRLYVADYIRGLAEVDAREGTVRWLRHDRNAALSGIDGLIVTGERTLVAVQNGVIPNRVIEITLDSAGGAVTATRVVAQDTSAIHEPTHGVVMGNEFHFIANSGWDGFGDDGVRLREARLSPPVILAIRLQAPSH